MQSLDQLPPGERSASTEAEKQNRANDVESERDSSLGSASLCVKLNSLFQPAFSPKHCNIRLTSERPCYRLNCVLPPLHLLTSSYAGSPGPQNVTVFGDKSFKGVIKVKGGHTGDRTQYECHPYGKRELDTDPPRGKTT